jgi:hypothetical protein
MITLGLGELLWLGFAQLGAFLGLTAVAVWLVVRAFRGIIHIQEMHISALAARLETEVGEMRRMVDNLKGRILSLEWYIVNNDLPVPTSEEQARELIAKRVQERAVAREMAQPTYNDFQELRGESARLRKRASQQLVDDVREEVEAKNKRTL